MKIGVLTFHRCINYGSYWQARCLVEGLRARGHDAELLDHDDLDVRMREWRCAFQPQLPTPTPRSEFPRYEVKTRKFLAAFDALPQSPRFPLAHPEQVGPYDLVVVGSDEVWNFRHPWYGNKGIFFGDGLRTAKLASYAASFGNHDAGEGMDSYWVDKLRRFDAISVRDENGRRLIREALGFEPALVLDPCLQFPPPAPDAAGEPGPYLALYGHTLPEWFAQAIRRYADDRGLPILSIGYHNEWADEQRIEVGPDEFNSLIAGAAALATNYFHGCVFALHHQRPFACAPSSYRYNKVRDLTALLGAEHHLVGEQTSPERYAELLDAPLEPEIQTRIAQMREQSNRYLDTIIG
jgi:hypothetical protein